MKGRMGDGVTGRLEEEKNVIWEYPLLGELAPIYRGARA
jgi:hypothetical protein